MFFFFFKECQCVCTFLVRFRLPKEIIIQIYVIFSTTSFAVILSSYTTTQRINRYVFEKSLRESTKLSLSSEPPYSVCA